MIHERTSVMQVHLDFFKTSSITADIINNDLGEVTNRKEV
jgi:hypothetical protein